MAVSDISVQSSPEFLKTKPVISMKFDDRLYLTLLKILHRD